MSPSHGGEVPPCPVDTGWLTDPSRAPLPLSYRAPLPFSFGEFNGKLPKPLNDPYILLRWDSFNMTQSFARGASNCV